MADLFHWFIDFVLHIDKHLLEIVTDYQTWTYVIIAGIIFCETGLVVTPFLPGDSLLFAAGALTAIPGIPISLPILMIVVILAAFAGDNTNYFIGQFLGHRIVKANLRVVKKEYIDRTHAFYEKHGGKTVVFARFMPILRTFAPFVAGIGSMTYRRFYLFSIFGNILWVSLFIPAGYFFGNLPFVKNNFSMVILGIIVLSLLPGLIAGLREKFSRQA